jgi:hypothetical protein
MVAQAAVVGFLDGVVRSFYFHRTRHQSASYDETDYRVKRFPPKEVAHVS